VTALRRVSSLLALALFAACDPLPPPPSAPAPAAAAPRAPGEISLAESVPLETSLDHADIPDAYEVWPAMIGAATRTLDLGEFYLSNAPQSRLEPVIQAVEAAADRGVAVRVLADAVFARKYPETLDRLAARRGIAVRRFDVGAVMGGVMHAKYFVVDGRDAFIGSQNFDWRSLTHVQELGVRLRDPAAAATFEQVFALDWALAAGEPPPPPAPPPSPPSFQEMIGGHPVTVTPVFSPERFLPYPGSWDLPHLVGLIDGARRSVHVQVLTYKAATRDGGAFPELDGALRRAAARGVEVQLLVADWSKRRGTVEHVQRLARVPGVAVHFIDIPPWSGGAVAFARVAHSKYMVVDGARSWVGTSNWEGDYFTKTRNVGVIVEGDSFAAPLERFFRDGFAGPYAEAVDPDRVYTLPRLDEK
jgi:phosphatidylserine/phosphatidylglycerophosphate/cardiolipin synthase-like enzyme